MRPRSPSVRAAWEPQPVAVSGGYEVRAGKRALRLAGGEPLRTPSFPVADAVAAEWRDRGANASVSELPTARLVAATSDVSAQRHVVEGAVAAYAETDLLSYRAGSGARAGVAARQEAVWKPLLDWARDRYGADLRTTAGLMPIAQDPMALRRLGLAVAQCSDGELAALRLATAACGSLVLALALLDGRLDAHTAWEISHLDERGDGLGGDPGDVAALEARRQDLADAERYVGLGRASRASA